MKKSSFAGKSIPVDFRKMSVKDLALLLSIIEDLVADAKKTMIRSLPEKEGKMISVPLRQLAKVFDVDYSSNIEFAKIDVAIAEIKECVEALLALEGDFFLCLKERNKVSGEKKKASLKLISQSKGVYGSNAG